MPLSNPFFREVGSGPGVVCLHANASTSGQWRPLMETLFMALRRNASVLANATLTDGPLPTFK